MTKRTTTDEVTFLRPGEAAAALKVTPKTLLRMAERGQIGTMRLPGGHRRYLEADVRRIQQGGAA